MAEIQKIMSDLEGLTFDDWHMYHSDTEVQGIAIDALELLKKQRETIASLALNKENAEQTRESIKPTVDEFGDAHCICGETVGHIPQNDKTLPKICLNYCYSCGRKLVWE